MIVQDLVPENGSIASKVSKLALVSAASVPAAWALWRPFSAVFNRERSLHAYETFPSNAVFVCKAPSPLKMAPSQPPSLQLQQPSLPQALAVAELVRRRSNAAVAAAEQRCSELAAEVERLREAVEALPAPPPPLQPLAQLLAPPPAAASAVAAAVGHSIAGAQLEGCLPDRLESVRLWHQALSLLPPQAEDPAMHQALAAAQRYVVLKELAGGPAGGLPALAAIHRTPVAALLELAGDLLQAHAATEAGGQQQAEGQQGVHPHRPQPTCLQHSRSAAGALLPAAVVAAVRLSGWPGQGASYACYASLQQFCSRALHLASCPPVQPAVSAGPSANQPAGSGCAAAAAAFSQAFKAPAGVPAICLDQPSCLVAQQVLTMLHGSPTAGMVLLSCAAPSTRDCMAALVAAVLGEPRHALDASSLGGSSSSALLCGSFPGTSSGGESVGSVGCAEEARLLAALQPLSQQLSAGLHALPQWVQATGLGDSSFLEVRLDVHAAAWWLAAQPTVHPGCRLAGVPLTSAFLSEAQLKAAFRSHNACTMAVAPAFMAPALPLTPFAP